MDDRRRLELATEAAQRLAAQALPGMTVVVVLHDKRTGGVSYAASVETPELLKVLRELLAALGEGRGPVEPGAARVVAGPGTIPVVTSTAAGISLWCLHCSIPFDGVHLTTCPSRATR